MENTTVVIENNHSENLKSAKTITHVIYALYAASLLVGVTYFVAIVINYVKKDDVAGTFLESHFRWQIRTFWLSVLWGVLGAILTLVIIGYVVLFVLFIWYIYRIAKGWLRLVGDADIY